LELQGFDAAYLERLRKGHPETERQFAAYSGELVSIKLPTHADPETSRYPFALERE